MAPPPSPTWPRPKGQRTVLAGKPPALDNSQDMASSCRIPLPSPAPSQQAASGAEQRPSDGTTGLCPDGGCPGQAQGHGPWRGASHTMGLDSTSRRRWQAWLAAAPLCAGGPWAPLPAAPAEHNRDGTWQPPASSASRPSTRRQGWRRPSAPASAPAPRVPQATPSAGVSAGKASQQHPSPMVQLNVLTRLPLPSCCPHSVLLPGDLAPSPDPPGVPSP